MKKENITLVGMPGRKKYGRSGLSKNREDITF